MNGRTLLDWLRSIFGGADAVESEPERPRSAPPAPVPPPAEASGAFDDSRIPKSAKKKVAVIREMIDELETRAAAKGGLVQERLELEQIQTVHLPRLLKSYVEIPSQHRAEIFRTTGHSASFVLAERLDRIIERLAEISRLLAQGDLDAFAANIRFIDTRYGAPGSNIDW